MPPLTLEEVFGNTAQGQGSVPSKPLTLADVFSNSGMGAGGDSSVARDVPAESPKADTSSPSSEPQTLDQVFAEKPGLVGYGVQTASRFAQGALPAVTGTMKGFAARTAKVGGVDPALQQPGMERLLEPYAIETNEAAPKIPLAEQPLYRAGTALEKGAENVLPSTKDLNEHFGNFVGGFGSVVGNALVSAANPVAGMMSAVEQGKAEAADNAIQAKATPEQQIEAANSGLAHIAGATDLVDSLLPGVGAATGKLLERVVPKVVAAIGSEATFEGIQEATQQFLQNWNAQNIYDPNKKLTEDVLYNGIIGGLVGGAAGGIHHGVFGERTQPELTPQTIEDLFPSSPTVQPSTPHTDLGTVPTTGLLAGGPLTSIPPAVQTFIDHAKELASVGQANAAVRVQTQPQVEQQQPSPDQMAPIDETIKAKSGVNVSRVVPLLSTSLYGNESIIPTITVKEMLQNSYDAIKSSLKGGQKEGNIDIRMDSATRTISIQDDGAGMSPETLAGPFLEVAGTGKEEDADSSGGLGIAKLLFLYANQAISVTTLRDGKVSELTTTGEDLFKAMQGLQDQPDITVRKPTQQDRDLFPQGHGTVVMVKVPETYTDSGTGRTHPIPFEADQYSHSVLRNSPLFAPINVRFNGEDVYNSGKLFPTDNYTPLVNGKYDWGDARIYVAKKSSPYLYQNVHVLSNGIWQFSFELKTGSSPGDTTIPYQFYIDMKPSVKPTHSGYPFAPNRQSFRDQAAESIAPLLNYLGLVYKKAQFDADVQGFGGMTYTNPDGTSSGEIKLVTKKKTSDNLFTLPKPGEEIHVENGKMSIRGREIPQLTPDQMEDFEIDFAEVQIEQSDIDPRRPLLHDNIQIKTATPDVSEQTFANQLLSVWKKINGEEPLPQQPSDVLSPEPFVQRSMTDFMRDRYGLRFTSYMHKIGDMFIELRDAVAQAMGTSELNEGVPVRGVTGMNLTSYDEMKTEGIGVSFDVNYRGVSIKVPFSGMFINPAATKYRDTLRASIGMFGTMIHELAHYKIRSHNAEFPAEMQDELINLETVEINNRLGFGVFDIQGFKQRLVNLVATHEDINKTMYEVMDGTFGNISPRGKRFESGSYQQTGDAGVAVGAPGQLPVGRVPGGSATGGAPGANAAGQQSRSGNVSASVSTAGSSADNGLAANQRALGETQRTGSIAVSQQPEFQAIRTGLKKLFNKAGQPVPPGVQQAAAHADKINKLYKWTAGILELMYANPRFTPLIRYVNNVRAMHQEEVRIQGIAQLVAMQWRDLGKTGDRLTGYIHELNDMTYRSTQEAALGVGRHPTPQEDARLHAKYKLDMVPKPNAKDNSPELKVYLNMKALIDGYHSLVAQKIIDRISNNHTMRPATQQNRIQAVQNELAALKSRPWFPMMRFGQFFVHVKDVHGKLKFSDAFQYAWQQQRALRQYQRNSAPGDTIQHGKYPEQSGPLIGMPNMLLEEMKSMKLSPEQLNDITQLQLAASMGLQPVLAPSYQRKYQVPGFASKVPTSTSLDARRSFAKFFFYGAKYYSKLAYRDQLVDAIEDAKQYLGQSNKVGGIVDFMQDHLKNNVDDIQSDFGFLKGAIFTYAMGGSVAAATANGIQTVGVTLPFLGDKFGDIRATKELTQAMTDFSKFRKRGHYIDRNNPLQGFEDRALGYAIQNGYITETMAPWLAALSHGSGLLNIGGNRLQNGWVWFQEKSAVMFETVEQFNRRIAFTAALRLAMKNNNAKVVDEAVNFNPMEYDKLVNGPGIGPPGTPSMKLTVQQARALVTANYVVDRTQFNYASVYKPRIMRGRKGTVLVFKRFVQSLYYLLGQNKGTLFRYWVYSFILGGYMGTPLAEELAGILKAVAWMLLGKDFDLEREVRAYVHDLTGGRIDPDLVLHGFARRGFGLPAVADMLGSLVTGRPGRGLEAPHQDENGNKIGGYQNVPLPVLDRSKAISPGGILPIDVGAMFGPAGTADTNKAIAQGAQKASGAAFSVGFNLYKAAMATDEPGWKRWERVLPRALASASAAFRGAVEGQDTGPGGAASITYNLRDPEEVAELIAQAAGYQPLRKQAKWDEIMAESEVNKFYEISRKSLLSKYFNATQDGRDSNIEDARQAIVDYNEKLPDTYRGYAITGDQLRASMQQRQKSLQSRETGIPIKRAQRGVAERMHELYPESTVNVQRPVGDR